MLRALKDLIGFSIRATDGNIGRVVDLLFDDQRWTIRHLVADTGGFLDVGRRVLVSPISFRRVDWSTRNFHLALTKEQINTSPSIDFDKPVSRQHERSFYGHYGYPRYWGALGVWGTGMYPGLLGARDATDVPCDAAFDVRERPGDVHLRSVAEVSGYHVDGIDKAIGHIEDLIVDDTTWEVRYLVIGTSNWWVGKSVLVAPKWATVISWKNRQVHLGISREMIKNSPEWDPAVGIERDYETRLYDHYGCPIYWNKGDGHSTEAFA